MPRKLSRIGRLVTTAGIVAAALGVLPGNALAAECPVQPTSQAFAEFGDPNSYFLAPGGSFDALSWTKLGGTPTLAVDNPLALAGGATALDLDKDEAVASSAFCVDRTMPHLRFVADYAGGGQLDIEVKTTYASSSSTSTSTSIGSISPADHATWAPSRYVTLNTSGIPEGESGTLRITLRSQGYWRVDDVFVDPYRR